LPNEPPELRVCNFGFLRAAKANNEADDDEAPPELLAAIATVLPLAGRRSLRRPFDDVVVVVKLSDDADDDDDDDEELLFEEEEVSDVDVSSDDEPSLLDFVFDSESLSSELDESCFLCFPFPLPLPVVEVVVVVVLEEEVVIPTTPVSALGSDECRLIFDLGLHLVFVCGFRGGIGVQGRLVEAAAAAAAACAARTTSISSNGAL